MNIRITDPPRNFQTGTGTQIADCARIELEANEQVTFHTPTGAEYDVARMSWGFYATPSLNGRLAKFGLRALLIRNRDHKYYVLLVELGKEADLQQYLDNEGHATVCWLDCDAALAALEHKLKENHHG